MTILAEHVESLRKAGYEVDHISPTWTYVVVKDPVSCSSGRKQWTETREVTLTRASEIFRFINERS